VNLIDRKLVKQTVMTSVYGVTAVGARAQVREKVSLKQHSAVAVSLQRTVDYNTIQYNTLWRNLPWEPQGSTSLRAALAHTLFSCIIPFISVGRLRSPSVNSGTR
jgi:hypothetical protein